MPAATREAAKRLFVGPVPSIDGIGHLPSRGEANLHRLCPRKRTSAAYSIIDLLETQAVTTIPVYARDTDWSSAIGLPRRTPMLASS